MKKVLVTGASGMIASRFIELAGKKLDITSVDEKTLDITQQSLVLEYLTKNKFDSVINFAAYTNVDGAEKERGNESGLVWKLNVQGVRNLIEACRSSDTLLIQISTDFVFPGSVTYPGPYSESDIPPDIPAGIGWYGWTKRIGEKDIKNSKVRSAVVRITYPFMSKEYVLKQDWAKTLIKLYNEKKLYPLFTDQKYCILFIDDLAVPLLSIINKELTGVFHVASNNTTTPYESGKYLLERYFETPVKIAEAYIYTFLSDPNRTPRPVNGGLDTEVTEKKLGIRFKSWREMIDEFVAQAKSSSV